MQRIPRHKKQRQLIHVLPTRIILIPVLSGGNASGNLRKSGKDRRFGLTGKKTCATGEGAFNDAALSETGCRGGWSPGSQA